MDATSVRWIRVNGYFSLEKLCGFQAVPGGTDTDGATFYIIQGFHEGAVHCGKTRVGLNGNIPHGGREIELSSYNVLVFNSQHHSFRHEIGEYATTNYWESVAPGSGNSQVIQFTSEPALAIPSVLVGIKKLDMGLHNARVRAHAVDITSTHFTAQLDSWADTVLYNGTLSWLKLAAGDPDFQRGVFPCSAETTETIPFNWHFDRPPIVFVGLCGIDIGHPWRIHVHTSDVSRTDFQLHAEKWGETAFHACSVTWIAFPSDKPGITCGSFGGTTTTTEGYSGSIRFPPAFRRPPMIFTAFTKLDLDPNVNLRVETEMSNVTSTSMDWLIRPWLCSRVHKVRVAYLALDPGA